MKGRLERLHKMLTMVINIAIKLMKRETTKIAGVTISAATGSQYAASTLHCLIQALFNPCPQMDC